MGKKYDRIPDSLITWILKQEIFWVATAPLSEYGHVNVSPKGVRGTFHVEHANRVWYEDLTGSGCETIAHIRENKRITFLFHSLDGPPRIVRLFGEGHVYEFGTPEYDSYIPLEKRLPSSRAIVACDVDRVGTSCGWGIPYYSFQGHRKFMYDYFHNMENKELAFDAEKHDAENDKLYEYGMKNWWLSMNTNSIDGLPSLESCFKSNVPVKSYIPDPKVSGVRLDTGKGKSLDEEAGDIELTEQEARDMEAVKVKEYNEKNKALGKIGQLLKEWKELSNDIKMKIIWAFVAGVMMNSFVKVLNRVVTYFTKT